MRDRHNPRKKDPHAAATTPRGISFLLGRTYFAYRTLVQQVLRDAGYAGIVKAGIGPILFSLFVEDGCSATDLAERLGMTKSTITKQIAYLEKTGMVRTEPDANDGRAIRIYLTPKARALEAPLGKLSAFFDQTVVTGLAPGAAKQYARYLERSQSNILSALDEHGRARRGR